MQTYLVNMPDFKEIAFKDFYKLYPRKVGKFMAEKSFNKLYKRDKMLAHTNLMVQIKVWKSEKKDKKFMLHPSTWINQKRWEDSVELPPEESEKPKELINFIEKYNGSYDYDKVVLEWEDMSINQKQEALKSLKHFKFKWEDDDDAYKPNLENFLNKRLWEKDKECLEFFKSERRNEFMLEEARQVAIQIKLMEKICATDKEKRKILKDTEWKN